MGLKMLRRRRRSRGLFATSSKYARKKCPWCGAHPGQKCIRPGGGVAETHMARIRACR